MRSHRPNILAPAALILVALVAALAACSSGPQRLSRQAQPTQPPAQLDLELVDRLGQDWSINYVQVYLDGWLIWQGTPQNGARSLGRQELAGAGRQELYVRVVATKAHGGQLASARKMVRITAGTQKVKIQLNRNFIHAGRFSVSLDQG